MDMLNVDSTQSLPDESLRNLMRSSQKKTRRSLSVWQFTLFLSVTYIIGLFISHSSTVMEQVYWSGYKLERLEDGGSWVEGNRFNIGSDETIRILRFTLSIDDSQKWQKPIGLMLGGPFSAEVTWDGELIGSKGSVGKDVADEIPGPIDTVLFVPSRHLTPGTHEIGIRLSTQHLLVTDDSVFHYIWLTPYRESGRRALRYYATPLVVLSALLILSFQSVRIGRNAGNAMHTGLGLFGFSIAVLLLTEITRALVNYPYHYHELRGFLGWLSNLLSGLALVYTCFRMTHNRSDKAILFGGVILVFMGFFVPMKSGDMKLALEFITLSAVPALVFSVHLFRKQISYLCTLPLFSLACAVSSGLSVGLFLDSFQFVAALVLIGGAWLWVYVDVRRLSPEPNPSLTSTSFVIRTAEGEKTIHTRDCVALKGEGNYTTLILENGSTLLHQDGLGAIMDSQPEGFARVHKSYAVNIARARRLRSATGSKYWLDMSNGEKVPVSRYRAAEVRSLLKDT